jgi:hypothetical protein
LNDGQIQNPSNPFGIAPLSNFAPRGFGFVYHSIAILYHAVPNLSLTIRNFLVAVHGQPRARRGVLRLGRGAGDGAGAAPGRHLRAGEP